MRAALVVLVAVACKSDAPEATAPSTDTELTEHALPQIAGAKPMGSVRRTGRDIRGTWCIDEADVVARITQQLRTDGWTNIETLEHTTYRSLAAKRDRLRVSAQLHTGDDRCAGTVVNLIVAQVAPAMF